MDYSALAPPAPRLRIMRQQWLNTASEISSSASVIALSMDDGGDEDGGSTPRRPAMDIISDDTPITSTKPVTTPASDRPAERLRELLSRVPNSATPKAPVPSSPRTEVESDFDPPRSSSSPQTVSPPHSTARESLKDIFTRALRDPEDSPVKRRRRRNSASSVGENESVRTKWVKRTSLSDEETENLSKYHDRLTPESSFRSSQAAFFDSLRERLSHSIGSGSRDRNTKNSQLEAGPSGTKHTDTESSVTSGSGTPPAATSTPLRDSVSQFPSVFTGSNLLSEDSGLQRLVKGAVDDSVGDNFLSELNESVSAPIERPVERSTPPPTSANNAASSSKTVKKRNGHSREVLKTHHSNEFTDSSSSRASSHQSNADFNERYRELEREEMKDREKAWNRPQYAETIRQKQRIRRQGSTASLTGSESGYGSSVAASPVAGQSHNKKLSTSRTKQWTADRSNHSTSTANHSRSNNSPQAAPEQRLRTISQPTHPSDTPIQLNSPSPSTRPRSSTLSHHRSTPSIKLHRSRLSDAESSSSSIASRDSADGSEVVVQQERERNWMSNHPVWHAESHSGRQSPVSPMTQSQNNSFVRSHSKSPGAFRQDYERPGFSARHYSSENLVLSGDHPSHLTTPSMSRHTSDPGYKDSQDTIKGNRHSTSRFGWLPSLSKARPSLPVFASGSPHDAVEHKDDVSQSPIPSSPAVRQRADSTSRSHIPVRTRKTSETSVAGNESDSRSHLIGSLSNLKQKGTETTVERVNSSSLRQDQPTKNDNQNESMSNASMGVENNIAVQENDTILQGTIHRVDVQQQRPNVPNPLPTTNDTTNDAVIPPSTPKKQISFQRSRTEFQTPSPPRNMPDLPGPPLSSDGEDTDQTPPVRTPKTPALDYPKTPRPPGAWGTPLTIPALVRSQSVPPEDELPHKDDHTGDFSMSAPPTLSRGQSSFPETPAPPGAWLATPGSVRRRSILKVRFDDQTRNESHPITDAGHSIQTNQDTISTEGLPVESSNTHQTSHSINESQLPSTPTLFRPLRTPRRSPTVRMVDAFGVELPGESLKTTENQVGSDDGVTAAQSSPSRSQRSRIRVVDAMGREVNEEQAQEVSMKEEPDKFAASGIKVHKEIEVDDIGSSNRAKEVLRDTISSMKEDMAIFDSESDATFAENQHVMKLNELSQKARTERVRIMRQMQSSQSSLSAKLRATALRWSATASGFKPTNKWTFWYLLTFNLLLIVILYRFTVSRAHHLFLTSYYDPLYPGLHLHGATLFSPHLSAGTIPWQLEPITSSGWGRSIMSLWNELVFAVLSFYKVIWDVWTVAPGQMTVWPPS